MVRRRLSGMTGRVVSRHLLRRRARRVRDNLRWAQSVLADPMVDRLDEQYIDALGMLQRYAVSVAGRARVVKAKRGPHRWYVVVE